MSKKSFLRHQLLLLRPILNANSLSVTRRGQELVGRLMPKLYAKDTRSQRVNLEHFCAAWVRPNELSHRGVILYLHGGGYACGDLEYAAGVGALLASSLHCNVFAPAYRLAPEHPFPAALEDAEAAYRYLLQCGYHENEILLCGESAGGGLLFSLCMRLREKEMGLPSGLIAISPWTDLSASGASYTQNAQRDPSMTKKQLNFFADAYTKDRTDPLVSPLFGDLFDLPPTRIFVGGDEIMLDDARQMHQKLIGAGVDSVLTVAEGLWHAYPLYGLSESRRDLAEAERFLESVLPHKKHPRWMRLDNAAKIYPAALRKNWSNVFRVSATFSEPIRPEVMQTALDITARRFPSIAVRLRRGVFWYYLEEIDHAPDLQPEKSHPLVHMPLDDIRKCAFRVLYYQNRVAVEFFHALTDGNGAMVFLKTLAAEYLRQRYGVQIPTQNGVLDVSESAKESELTDDFLKNAGPVALGRGEASSYHVKGTPDPDRFLTVTTGMLDSDAVRTVAKSYGVSVTGFLCAVMMQALLEIQAEQIPTRRHRKPVKVLLPVNLRPFFGSESLRNFVLFITPGVDPRLGEYTFEELCKTVYHQMGCELTAKRMQMRITANVSAEKSMLLKLAPLPLKNLAMKLVYAAVGENKFCLTLSNLGKVDLPKEMIPYVTRMDFSPGVQATSYHNCGVLSYDGTLYINFIRSVTEPTLEAHFFACLKRLGLTATVESNSRYQNEKGKG